MSEEFQEFSKLLLRDIDNSKTLEELGLFTLRYLVATRGIDKRYMEVLANRVSWVNGRGTTLDEAGRRIGVTRERVRQVESKLNPLSIDLVVAPKLVYALIGILGKAQTWRDFCSEVTSKGLSANVDNWTSNSLKELVNIFSVPNVIEQFNELIKSVEPIVITREVAGNVRSYRNALGLIDLSALSQGINRNRSQCIEILRNMYPFVVVANGLAMANQRQGGSVTNVILKQLSIKSPLSPSILVEGIERATNYRRTPMVGSQEDLEALVVLIAGNPPSRENVNPDVSDDFELGDTELWLQSAISGRPLGIIHRDELTELAIADGVNPSSVGAYLSMSTIIRNVGPGIFSLVGTEVELSVIEAYRKRFLAEYVPPLFSYSLIDERRMELSLVPNSALYTGGSLSIDAGLTDLVTDFRFVTQCQCGSFTSEADIRIAPSGYWVGFTALLMHSRKVHKGGPGIQVSIIFDFYDLTAELKID